MKYRLFLFMAAIFILPAGMLKSAFAEETFYLYGYLANYFQSSFVYTGGKLSDTGYGDTLAFRLKGDWSPEESLNFHAEAAYYGRLGNQNHYAFYDSAGLSPQTQDGSPLSQDQFPYNDFVSELVIDHAWGLVNLGHMDFQFGKIPIAWGTGYVFNPTAKTARVSFLDTVTEETPGTVGVVPSLYAGDTIMITGYLAFQDRSHKAFSLEGDSDWDNLPFGLKVQVFAGPVDVSAGIIKEVMYNQTGFQKEYYLSTDLDGAVRDVGIYCEAALRWPLRNSKFSFRGYSFEESLEAVAGGYYTVPLIDVDLRVEYFHQGGGESIKSKYDIMKVLSGELLMLGENYLFAYLERAFPDYYTAGAGSIINLNDGSLVVYPEFTYNMYNNFQISLGSFIFFGGKGSEFNGEHNISGVGEIDLTETFSLYARCKISF